MTKAPAAHSAFQAISALSYTVVIVRDMEAMRAFYEGILCLNCTRQLSENWYEYRIGGTTLALSSPGLTRADAPVPENSAALQLAFEVPVDIVDACAAELVDQGIGIVSPPTNRDFGHRTLFFRDPDGNLIEIYAEL